MHQAGEDPETTREYGPLTPSGVPRALWWNTRRDMLEMIDQSALPADLAILTCSSVEDVAHAIRTMKVRGAPAIGIAAAFGLALGARAAVRDTSDRGALRAAIAEVAALLVSTRGGGLPGGRRSGGAVAGAPAR
jgi:methylthioribose-1-phosphate isomerase